MNELSREARALLSRTRTAHDPSAQARAEVRSALARRLVGASAAATALASTQLASGASAGAAATGAARLVLGLKWLAGGLLIGNLGSFAVAEGVARLSQREAPAAAASSKVAHSQPAASPRLDKAKASDANRAPLAEAEAPPSLLQHGAASAPRSERLPSPQSTAAPSEIAEAHVEPAPTTGAFASLPTVNERALAAPVIAKPPAAALAEEARELAEAQRAFSRGESAQALRLLAVQEQKFGGGLLASERSAARVFALCALGQRDRARAEAEHFLSTWSGSPLAGRVRSSCGKP